MAARKLENPSICPKCGGERKWNYFFSKKHNKEYRRSYCSKCVIKKVTDWQCNNKANHNKVKTIRYQSNQTITLKSNFNHYQNWTLHEIEYLMNNRSILDISIYLGRSLVSCIRMRTKMNKLNKI